MEDRQRNDHPDPHGRPGIHAPTETRPPGHPAIPAYACFGARNAVESGIRSPCLSDAREQHADWLELCALKDSDRNASLSDLIRELDVSGSLDASPSLEDTPEEEDVVVGESVSEESGRTEGKNQYHNSKSQGVKDEAEPLFVFFIRHGLPVSLLIINT